MAIFISAGHVSDPKSPKYDPGAISNGQTEASLTKELRDLIIPYLEERGSRVVKDLDAESLGQYISRIKPGTGSVLCDIHFNAGQPTANGVEVLVKDGAENAEIQLGIEICKAANKTCGLKSRGVKSEKQSHRGKLGVLHTKAGISVLVEVCFITNESDLDKYQAGKTELAKAVADLLYKYDAVYS